jgi:hypothetical protein
MRSLRPMRHGLPPPETLEFCTPEFCVVVNIARLHLRV